MIAIIVGFAGSRRDISQAYELTPMTESGAQNNSKQIPEALAQLKRARKLLRAHKISQAEQALRQCIKIADMPSCHHILASLWTILDDPRAQNQLKEYLRVAPKGKAADNIRRFLKSNEGDLPTQYKPASVPSALP